ncbi:MAG TPA: prolyl oligopeptidase family serine peptidase [Actinopolymorphaceae bacterium]
MSDDPYAWLEGVTDETALSWVRERNAETLADLAEGQRFERLQTEIRQVLDSDDRIPYVTRRGEHLYNFWRDAEHPRGLWRRTTLEEYRTSDPAWDVLLDVDALAAKEDENWVWQGAAVLRPTHDRCLVYLSRGGADASVVREYDLETRAFVADGFQLPEAKSRVAWIDRDRVYVGTDFGPGSLTTSGYPRIAKEWRRGTPLDAAVTVFEGDPGDVSVSAVHDFTEGFERDFVHQGTGFYSSREFLRTEDGNLVRIDVPEDAEISVRREWLLVGTRTPWLSYPAGALLAIEFDRFMAGARDFTVLFEPDAHTSLAHYAWTRHHLLLNTLSDVKNRLETLTPTRTPGAPWSRTDLAGLPTIGSTSIIGTDPDHSDEFFLESSGFTEPSTLRYGHVGGDPEILKQGPTYFDAEGLAVEQWFATSDDGTSVPYFVVRPERGGTGPVLMTGYGGFEVPLMPYYSGVVGRAWLARGGTYVVANIRGGGEYGPGWHQAALREKRPRAYEDFAAVARHLVSRGVTTPQRLGIRGGSNGGLLMGVMLTCYPDLFGAIVCLVPLLDMRRYHELLAGASWMAEYGDPDNPDDWAFLEKYSPYHNVASGPDELAYPPLLMMTSTRDDRVHPGHARKMSALLRERGYDVRYHENIEGGPGAAADNEQAALREALQFEFLWRRLGSPETG